MIDNPYLKTLTLPASIDTVAPSVNDVDSAPYLLIKSTDVKHKLKHRFEWLWSNIDSVLPCPFFPLSFVALMSTSSATYLFF